MNKYLELIGGISYIDSFCLGLVDFVLWVRWLLLLALMLTIADLVFGVKASKSRGEKIRRSRAIKRTMNKICSYILWIFVAYFFGRAFGQPFGFDLLPLIILLVVYSVELESIYSNYFEAKGKKIKIDVFKFFGKKMDILEIKDEQKPNPEQDGES